MTAMRRITRAHALDMIEKTLLVALFSGFAARLLEPALENPFCLILVMSEATVVLLVLVRRDARIISERPLDWLLGVAGSGLPLLAAPPSGEPILPAAACALMMISGFGLQLAAKLTLRRSFGVVAANRGVKASGPYQIVRHPMYAGYVVTHIGCLLAGPTAWSACVYGAALCLQIARIRAEERVLGEDRSYHDFMARTRYRLVPGMF